MEPVTESSFNSVKLTPQLIANSPIVQTQTSSFDGKRKMRRSFSHSEIVGTQKRDFSPGDVNSSFTSYSVYKIEDDVDDEIVKKSLFVNEANSDKNPKLIKSIDELLPYLQKLVDIKFELEGRISTLDRLKATRLINEFSNNLDVLSESILLKSSSDK